MNIQPHLLFYEGKESILGRELSLVPADNGYFVVDVLECDAQERVDFLKKFGELDQNKLHGLQFKVLGFD